MTCREIAEFLREYYDGELAADARTLFEKHLAVCPECVRYLDSYRATIQIARLAWNDLASTAGPPPEELVQAILSARLR